MVHVALALSNRDVLLTPHDSFHGPESSFSFPIKGFGPEKKTALRSIPNVVEQVSLLNPMTAIQVIPTPTPDRVEAPSGV